MISWHRPTHPRKTSFFKSKKTPFLFAKNNVPPSVFLLLMALKVRNEVVAASAKTFHCKVIRAQSFIKEYNIQDTLKGLAQ